MSEFKASLKKRIMVATVIFIGFLVVFVVLLWQQNNSSNRMAEFINGYQVGGVCGLALFAFLGIWRYSKALKDSDYLKKLYIYETDERNRLIYEKSGSLGMNIVMFGLVGVAIIAGFYNEVVTLTLIAVTLAVGSIRLALKLYYRGRY